jgi:NAD-dependent deacetylase
MLFNEPFAEEIMDRAYKVAEQADLFLVLGSSLMVAPANQLPLMAKKAGAKLIFLNREPTIMDKYCTLRILGNLGETLPALSNEV